MALKDVLAAFMATEGAVFPENMEADLIAAYDEDFGISAAAVEAANTENGRLNDEITALKVRLHDYMAAEAAGVATEDDNDTSGENADETDPEDASFDDFFSDTPEDKDK